MQALLLTLNFQCSVIPAYAEEWKLKDSVKLWGKGYIIHLPGLDANKSVHHIKHDNAKSQGSGVDVSHELPATAHWWAEECPSTPSLSLPLSLSL